MQSFEVDQILAQLSGSPRPYLEFLRSPEMSCGIYALPAGAEDRQSPHHEAELYHILRGRAVIRVGVSDRKVGPGSLIFVEAQVEHRFHSIEEDLVVLVVFAPPEYSQAPE